jgi:hypothetical protein
MYCSMINTIPESKVMMHPNPGCRLNITYQNRPFKVIINAQLLVLF